MRIVHTESSLGWGGQEIRILSESQGLMSRGHELRVICPREARIHDEAGRRGVPVTALPIGRKNAHGVLAMRGWLLANACDVVNTHSSTDSWLAAIAAKAVKVPPALVRTRHISAAVPDNAPTRWLYQRAAKRIVTTGESIRRALIEVNGYLPDSIVSIPTGIDSRRFRPGERLAARRVLGLPEELTLVAIVATLRSWKGHRYLLEALAGLPAAIGLAVVGDGPQRAAIEKLVDTLGVRERVWLAGNQDDVLPWLHAADVFALPSYANEGVPQALVQAMMTGLACVTTGAGSIGELAEHEKTALVVPGQDPVALREAVARLAGDPTLRARLGKAAREFCVARYAYETMLDRMEAVYRDAGAQ
jgi:glycosyltransferase involved in cell wall biosynthesis